MNIHLAMSLELIKNFLASCAGINSRLTETAIFNEPSRRGQSTDPLRTAPTSANAFRTPDLSGVSFPSPLGSPSTIRFCNLLHLSSRRADESQAPKQCLLVF